MSENMILLPQVTLLNSIRCGTHERSYVPIFSQKKKLSKRRHLLVDLIVDRTIMLKCVFKQQNAKLEMDKVKYLKI